MTIYFPIKKFIASNGDLQSNFKFAPLRHTHFSQHQFIMCALQMVFATTATTKKMYHSYRTRLILAILYSCLFESSAFVYKTVTLLATSTVIFILYFLMKDTAAADVTIIWLVVPDEKNCEIFRVVT